MPSARTKHLKSELVVEKSHGPYVPSEEQRAINDWFANGDGHLIVEAYAGVGKTSSILHGISFAPERSILLCAFNKLIQEELAERVENPYAKAQTLHSIGYQAIRRAGGVTRMEDSRFAREDALGERVTQGAPWGAKRLVSKLVTKARELTPFVIRKGKAVEGAQATLEALAIEWDLIPPPPSDDDDNPLTIAAVARMTRAALEIAANERPVTGIDYADMIFLPLVNGWFTPQYDLIVVDERQDMTRAQLDVARAVAFPYARMVFVGDFLQSIYGFRGADTGSAKRLKSELNATTLPLTMTYRCPRKVVELASKYAPGYRAAENAPEGTIDSVDSLTELVEQAQPGDFILSRKNAPLARIVLSLLRAGKRAKIQGREIGSSMTSLVRKIAGKHKCDTREFLVKLRAWEEREVNRFLAMKRDDKIDLIHDKAATLFWLSDGCDDSNALQLRIDYLFTDNGTGSIVCSTVHKAKGLEANRVFIVESTFFISAPCECGHRHLGHPCERCDCKSHDTDLAFKQEESNLYYTAITRARRHLTHVTGVK